ncbi:MAG: chemotaxis protein CheW [Candidatus Omnitrophica bacterium]|nr:chemotaxis protein CheW [Candidatus Omnitrophota bacterium]
MSKTAEKQEEFSHQEKDASDEITTICIDSRKLDRLMNLSGELVTLRGQFAQLVTILKADLAKTSDKGISENRIRAFDDLTSTLGKVSSDIQSGVMQVRMVLIERIFADCREAAQRVSVEKKVNVDFKVEGEETEVDKRIIDMLNEPLIMMVEDAIVNGLDDLPLRAKFGKAEKGEVVLRAEHNGSSICISVRDDGKGLDVDRLVEKAIEGGFLTQEQAGGMDDNEKAKLLFVDNPEISDKKIVQRDIVGGMHSVREMISSVNGLLDVKTERNQGTTVAINIPLTLSIFQTLLVRVSDQVLAIPIEAVTEIIKIQTDEIYSIDGNDTVKLRGHALSLIDLRKVLGIQGEMPGEGQSRKVVVVTDGEIQVGIEVDSLIGEDEIVIKALSEYFLHVKGVAGASILGDGRVALILDPVTIIKAAS